MKFIQSLFVAMVLISVLFSCREYESGSLPDNNFRIKKILELNENGEELLVHTFTYENDQLILWRSYSREENNELREIKKVEVTYEGNTLSAIQFQKVKNEWVKHQGCVFTVKNNLIVEKQVSRYSFPECMNCWKYQYRYIGAGLEECTKFFCDSSDDWKPVMQQHYTYEKNILVKYESFVGAEDGRMELDYLRNYSVENSKVSGWEGGVIVQGTEWHPVQKKEFVYEQDLMKTETYSVWNEQNKLWKFFGSVRYYYDINNKLIEEISSNGNSVRYEYETGKGNAPLIYCDPTEDSQPVPTLKK